MIAGKLIITAETFRAFACQPDSRVGHDVGNRLAQAGLAGLKKGSGQGKPSRLGHFSHIMSPRMVCPVMFHPAVVPSAD